MDSTDSSIDDKNITQKFCPRALLSVHSLSQFHTARGPGTTGFSRTFKKSGFKMADSQRKNSNKSILFRRNIDQYSLGEST